MRLLRSFHALAFLLVLLSITGLAAAQQSVGLLLVAGTLAVLSWYVTEGPRGRTLPRWVSNLLVLAVALNVIVDYSGNRDDLMGVLGRFAVWLTLIKLYERRTARDHAHLLLLSLVLMLTGCLRSTDLIFGMILLAYLVLGLYVLLLYQLQASFEEARQARLAAIPPGYRLVPPLRPTIGRHVGWQFRGMTAAIGALGFAVSVAVFLGFPRGLGMNLFGSAQADLGRRVSGFATEIDLSSGGRVNQSPYRALSVRVTNSQVSSEQFPGPLHLRGAVLDQYQGRGRWMSGRADPIVVHTSASAMTPMPHVDETSTWLVDVLVYRPGRSPAPLFILPNMSSIACEPPTELLLDPRRWTLKTGHGSKRLRSYRMGLSELDPHAPILDVGLADVHPVSVPRDGWYDDPTGAVAAQAQRILASARLSTRVPDDPNKAWRWFRDAAHSFTAYLHSSRFEYTLDLSSVRYRGFDDDPVAAFLSRSHRGRCEHFAAGLTALCHSVGIPARIVSGYLAYSYDPQSRTYNVVETNAHAWVEVMTAPGQWTLMDPTPAAALDRLHGGSTTWGQEARSAFQMLEHDWNSGFIAYDEDAQGRIAESFTRRWSERLALMWRSIRAWMEQVNQAFYFGPAGYVWMGIVAFALVIAVIALIKLMRRTLALQRALRLQHVKGAEHQRMLRQLGFYLDMLERLRKQGKAKPPWQPPLAYANALTRSAPDDALLVKQVTELYYAARYGRRTLGRQDVRRAAELVLRLGSS